ncbi:MAG: hypothetical protein K2M72_09430 [Paramuribaculum sp.]|nr:hypothetical protein [Paramuribaculum sp.]
METLKEVYEKHAEGLKALYAELKKNDLYDGCSYPLLLSTWDGEQTPKAMFFGQETNGWGNDEAGKSINGLMEHYCNFNLGDEYNTLFWKYFRLLSSKLGLQGNHPVLWNNINKIGKIKGKGRPNYQVTELENKHFNVLADELDTIKPIVCVFFTGPNYDDDIRAKLHDDVEFLPIDGYDVRWFARLKSKHLPENSFRIYHPGYGNRHSDWYKGVMDKIAEFSK